MKKIIVIVLIAILNPLSSCFGYGQMRKVYSKIETKNVLYYKVEEIVKMTFGGTTTRYTVSDLSLINKTELGPDNIRIITPIYKNESYKKKYYVEIKNLNKVLEKNREPTSLLEISLENWKIEISENAELEQESLALVLGKLTKIIPVPAIKNENQGEKRDFILINVIEVYERVLEKGYESVFMFKKVADYYYFKGQMEKATKWYGKLFEMANDLEPIYYYRFGIVLIKTGEIEKGNAMIEKFNQLNK